MLLFVLMGLFCATGATAGPFGLEMGMSLKDIGGKPEKVGPGKYKLTNVPRPHSAFGMYVVQVAPVGGLCWIKAIGKTLATSSYGIELKSALKKMEQKLEASYGKHKTIDFLMPGSYWDEPRDWMTGLIKKERVFGAIWEAEEKSSLPGCQRPSVYAPNLTI
jgi:hypothetical protein